ncbi:MAG: homoserine dehydrogenase, partial [Synechococcaceae bacterium WB9_4xC_028]|nr:homoserine dehydrogenase [Synechococcaceae bacterium WB9_4xC_028]
MATRIGIGLLGLGTVGGGVAEILQTPDGRQMPGLSELRDRIRDRREEIIDVATSADCKTGSQGQSIEEGPAAQ